MSLWFPWLFHNNPHEQYHAFNNLFPLVTYDNTHCIKRIKYLTIIPIKLTKTTFSSFQIYFHNNFIFCDQLYLWFVLSIQYTIP